MDQVRLLIFDKQKATFAPEAVVSETNPDDTDKDWLPFFIFCA